MSVETNPFGAAQYVPPPPQIAMDAENKPTLVHASKGDRFVNFFVDNLVLGGITFAIGSALGVIASSFLRLSGVCINGGLLDACSMGSILSCFVSDAQESIAAHHGRVALACVGAQAEVGPGDPEAE